LKFRFLPADFSSLFPRQSSSSFFIFFRLPRVLFDCTGAYFFFPWCALMSARLSRRKCRCCNVFFIPDRHNATRQGYCSKPDCRRASKAASQRRWLRKPPNRNYFRDAENVKRVQAWRKANPGYWKRAKSRFKQTQRSESQPVNPGTTSCNASQRSLPPLQDLVLTEHPAFVGLISMVTGRTLQEDIAAVGRSLLLHGQNILGLQCPEKSPSSHDPKTIASPRAPATGAAELQLG
jgi:hypothetical protein